MEEHQSLKHVFVKRYENWKKRQRNKENSQNDESDNPHRSMRNKDE